MQEERQCIDVVGIKVVATIQRSRTAVVLLIEGVGHGGQVTAYFVDLMRVGVGELHRKNHAWLPCGSGD